MKAEPVTATGRRECNLDDNTNNTNESLPSCQGDVEFA